MKLGSAFSMSLLMHGLLLAAGVASTVPVVDLHRGHGDPVGERVLQVTLGRPALDVRAGDTPARLVDIGQKGEKIRPMAAVIAENPLPIVPILPVGTLPDAPLTPPSGFWSSDQMDVRPVADGPVIVPFPEQPLGKPKGTVTLALYIQNDGVVRNVETVTSDVPSAFEEIAHATFLSARFKPGIRDGIPAPARMTILVEFEQFDA